MLMDGDPKIIGKLSSERMNSWYFSREELERFSPSRKDGISEIKESELRKLYCSFLRDVGIRLKLPQVTIATSMIFCHRFYLHQSHTKNGWQTIATVCIFLASKVEDTPCPLDQVIRAAYETMFKRDPAAAQRIHQKAVREKQKALILIGERLVLKTIRFDFNIQHPYRPLLDAMKNLGINQKEVRQVALNFVNDWLRTTLCLQYKPHYIAAGSLYLAAKLHNVKLPLEGTNVWWHKFDVAPKPLEAVIQQMMELVGLKLAVADPGPVKQSKSPSEAKLQIFNSPNSVLSQSSLSRSGLSPDIDGEPNGRLQVDSDQDFISSHTGQGANSCPDEKSLDVNTTGNGPSGTANGENKDQDLARKHGDGVISCPDVRSLDTNAAFESSNNCMELATTNYDHSNETLNGQNSSQALISGHRGDGVNPLSEGRLLDANAISKSTSKSVEPVMTNCNHCGDALNAASSCAHRRPANAATSSIENAPCVQPAQMNVDHFNEELKKIDVARIKDLLAKRKRQREIQQQAITSDDLSEQAWIERELKLGIGAKREAEHLVSSDDLSDDIWIERELESGIVVGPGNNQVVTLDGLGEDDWIERELESGIIVEPEHVGKKRRLESSCC